MRRYATWSRPERGLSQHSGSPPQRGSAHSVTPTSAGTASSIGRCTVPVIMIGTNQNQPMEVKGSSLFRVGLGSSGPSEGPRFARWDGTIACGHSGRQRHRAPVKAGRRPPGGHGLDGSVTWTVMGSMMETDRRQAVLSASDALRRAGCLQRRKGWSASCCSVDAYPHETARSQVKVCQANRCPCTRVRRSPSL